MAATATAFTPGPIERRNWVWTVSNVIVKGEGT